MSRKQFIESHGATCNNWRNSWSYVNHKSKSVIFGLFDTNKITEDIGLIFEKSWRTTDKGRKSPAYSQSLEHINLIENENYSLQIFLIEFSDEYKDKEGNGPAKIKRFTPKLETKRLQRFNDEWYAVSFNFTEDLGIESIGDTTSLLEGSTSKVTINQYERNPIARQKCLDYFGYSCIVCKFNFEKTYGEIGKNFIHVHHLIPLSEIKEEYVVDPLKDLVPVCPNCHAMLHRGKFTKSIEELKEKMKN